MAVTGTYNVGELIALAYKKAGIVGLHEDASGFEVEIALDELNFMLKSWQQDGIQLWLTSSLSEPASAFADYTLDPVRPIEIQSVRLKRSGIETPMTRMTRNEYDTLPDKDSTGLPTSYYYDRQREAARLYVWPVLASPSGETLEITYTAEFQDVTKTTDVLELPGETWETAVYCLADRLGDTFDQVKPKVTQRAEQLYQKMLGFDAEGSVFFGEVPPYAAT